MKQLIILSGKGGTGKTTVAAALIQMFKLKAFADCDVDAPNLHIISEFSGPPRIKDFYALKKAVIDNAKCVKCGICAKICRFDAIKDYKTDIFSCEGCGLCQRVCPANAVTMEEFPAGTLMLYKEGGRVFSTAQLNAGNGTSGKLVTAVKKQLKEEAETEIAVIDGSPGIGCPVIASISGAAMVLIVTEPTISGMHDMERIISTAESFGVRFVVCVNKYDVNIEYTKKIEDYCKKHEIDFVGKIPYDRTVIKALGEGKSIAAYPNSPATEAVAQIWTKIYDNLIGNL
jgi:MinD superfamily P-loop ATPase